LPGLRIDCFVLLHLPSTAVYDPTARFTEEEIEPIWFDSETRVTMKLDAAGQLEEDLREFLIESSENLANLDREIVALEQSPQDAMLISGIFRTIHTIKGTCSFFGFVCLGSVAHIAESILSQVREDGRLLTPALISLVLEAVDKIKALLVKVEATGSEGEDDAGELRERLTLAHRAFVPRASAEEQIPVSEQCSAASCVEAPAAVRTHPERRSRASDITPQASRPLQVEAADAGNIPKVTADVDLESREVTMPINRRRGDALADSTIRVDVALLNKLMNLVGELVLARNQLLQETNSLNPTLLKTSQRLNLITSELQEGVMKTRMQPIGVVWNKLPRVVRDLASQCGKKIQVEMIGAETELDKTIIEAINDPLTHIVRNSCDHGIEDPDVRIAKSKNPEGMLLLRAFHEGGVVNIEISDDGAGMNPELLKKIAVEKGLIRADLAASMADRDARHLIFAPGFSTAAKVTSISGRGVGMDVVKTNIEKIGGSVDVLEREPCGTIIRIKIPLTLAIIPGLVVSLDPDPPQMNRSCNSGNLRDQRFVVPQANLLELVRLEGERDLQLIKNLHGTAIFHHRGKLLPLVYLRRILGKPVLDRKQEVVNIVVVQAENCQMGLVVDHISDTQEIVVKPLGRQLKALTSYVGATIMGDGYPALILDVAGLARLAGLGGQSRQADGKAAKQAALTASSQTQMLLLFSAGSFERLAVPLSLVARLEEIETGKIERAAGRAVLHYRGNILPLISLSSILEPHRKDESMGGETAQVIVFTDGTRRVGVVVDQIVDIVDEAIVVRRNSPAPGLLGSAVIGGKITDLLDLHKVVEQCGENWLTPPIADSNGRKLLLLDANLPSREMISEYLGASGYEVISAISATDALPKMRKVPVDLVIAAVELRGDGGLDTLQTMRRDKQFEHIPILGLMEHEDQMKQQTPGSHAFNARTLRSERANLLESVATLVRCQMTPSEVKQ
jgi:two-component system chemotaxis sensor kinase CheA